MPSNPKEEFYDELFGSLEEQDFQGPAQLGGVPYKHKAPYKLIIMFGVPGSGKTTFAAKILRKSLKRNIPVFSNVPLKGAYMLQKEDLGTYMVERATIILDEASIDFNNREYRNLSANINYFLRYHRHFKTDIYVFSQSSNDMDITFRRLCHEYYRIQRAIPFVPFFVAVKIRHYIGVRNNNIEDIFEEVTPKILALFQNKYCFGPFYFSMFDSYQHKELPQKDWKKWG